MLQELLEQMDIPYTEDHIEKLEKYYELLIERNKVMNLTAITDHDEFMRKHFADSLALLKYYSFQDNERVMDVGTGGGFPGIPLKIFLPNVHFLLMDSVNKKLGFVGEVINDLGLEKIELVHGRAEDLAHDGAFREKYDVVVSRAVAPLPVLIELTMGFVKTGGYFVSYKGSSGEEELKSCSRALDLMGGTHEKTINYRLPGGDDERMLLFLKKTVSTPKRFPRKAGEPKRNPL